MRCSHMARLAKRNASSAWGSRLDEVDAGLDARLRRLAGSQRCDSGLLVVGQARGGIGEAGGFALNPGLVGGGQDPQSGDQVRFGQRGQYLHVQGQAGQVCKAGVGHGRGGVLGDFRQGDKGGFDPHRPLRAGFGQGDVNRDAMADGEFVMMAVEHRQGFGFVAGDRIEFGQIAVPRRRWMKIGRRSGARTCNHG